MPFSPLTFIAPMQTFTPQSHTTHFWSTLCPSYQGVFIWILACPFPLPDCSISPLNPQYSHTMPFLFLNLLNTHWMSLTFISIAFLSHSVNSAKHPTRLKPLNWPSDILLCLQSIPFDIPAVTSIYGGCRRTCIPHRWRWSGLDTHTALHLFISALHPKWHL